MRSRIDSGSSVALISVKSDVLKVAQSSWLGYATNGRMRRAQTTPSGEAAEQQLFTTLQMPDRAPDSQLPLDHLDLRELTAGHALDVSAPARSACPPAHR